MYDIIPQRCAAESYFVKKIICMIFDYLQEKKQWKTLTCSLALMNRRIIGHVHWRLPVLANAYLFLFQLK